MKSFSMDFYAVAVLTLAECFVLVRIVCRIKRKKLVIQTRKKVAVVSGLAIILLLKFIGGIIECSPFLFNFAQSLCLSIGCGIGLFLLLEDS